MESRTCLTDSSQCSLLEVEKSGDLHSELKQNPSVGWACFSEYVKTEESFRNISISSLHRWLDNAFFFSQDASCSMARTGTAEKFSDGSRERTTEWLSLSRRELHEMRWPFTQNGNIDVHRVKTEVECSEQAFLGRIFSR